MFRRSTERAERVDEAPGPGVIRGVVRSGRRTKTLVGRLQPGEIALIDHADLDRVSAESLVERKVGAVLNVARSSSGRYPNLGPLMLASAGVPLIDSVTPDLFDLVREGELIEIEDGRILQGGAVIAKGEPVTMELAQGQLDAAKRKIGAALESFAENTIEYLRAEREYLLEAIRLPEIKTPIAGRHVLVVVRGYGYKKDLASLRAGYIRDFRPVLIGVDGGADALLELGLKPDIIIGDMDSVETKALTCGAELVLHAYADGRAPGAERLDALGLEYRTFEAPGTSEDVAMLLAHEKGAELIVAVGSHSSLIELMDKGRKGMASTFLVRLRVGPKLVDAKGVSELHRAGASGLEIAGLVAAALFAMLVVVAVAGHSGHSTLLSVAAGTVRLWAHHLWLSLSRYL
ncbi:MAG TPA: putative cytokinetic ring protein SteA [Actinomycetota bacterium]|nr:putative cytokinetic ring protein SteA [Actinomycetota bacterium]